jgi:hypothetical protein
MRVIGAFGRPGALIHHLYATPTQMGQYVLFQYEANVIATKRNPFHDLPLSE